MPTPVSETAGIARIKRRVARLPRRWAPAIHHGNGVRPTDVPVTARTRICIPSNHDKFVPIPVT